MLKSSAVVFHEIMGNTRHVEREAALMQMDALALARRKEGGAHAVVLNLGSATGIELQVIVDASNVHAQHKQNQLTGSRNLEQKHGLP